MYDQMRDELYENLEIPQVLTTEILLYGDTNLDKKVNISIFREVQRYIISTKRF
jgi:hypothetical protein